MNLTPKSFIKYIVFINGLVFDYFFKFLFLFYYKNWLIKTDSLQGGYFRCNSFID